MVESAVLQMLFPLQLNEEEKAYLRAKVIHLNENWGLERDRQIQSLELRQGQLGDRLNRLTDAFIDGILEKRLFEERKAALLMERKDVEDKKAELASGSRSVPDELAKFLELAGSAYLRLHNWNSRREA